LKKKNVLLILTFLMILTMLASPLAVQQSHSVLLSYPLTNASVSASQTNGPGYGSNSTDTNGNYTINQGIPVGNYSVQASADYYLPASANTTIGTSSSVNTVNFNLGRSGIVAGRIIDNMSKPVVGASVTLNSNSSGAVGYAFTDSNGFYHFATNIDAGTYYVDVSFNFNFSLAVEEVILGGNYTPLPFSSPISPYLQHGFVEGRSPSFLASAGTVVTAPTMVLNGSGVITGTVRDAHSNPVPYAAVEATNQLTYQSFAVLTNAQGVYRISYDVIDGNYSLKAYHHGLVGAFVNVTAVQSGTVTQDLSLVTTATVQGHVWRVGDNKPLEDVSVELLNYSTFTFGSAYTDANGFYKITSGLGPANYTVQVTLGGFPVNMTSVVLTAGENLTLNFYVYAYFISGTVYENSTGSGVGVPYPDIELYDQITVPFPYQILVASTAGDVNGNYVLAIGYDSVSSGTVFTGNFTVSAYGYNSTTEAQSITIGTDVSNMNFALQKTVIPPPPASATIKGSVYGNSGPQLPFSLQNWTVVSGNATFPVSFNTSSDVSGVFGDLAAGTLSIIVSGPEGTSDTMTVWLPRSAYPLLNFAVTSFPGPNPTIVSQGAVGQYYVIKIQFGHSSKEIVFQNQPYIPEYSGPFALVALMTLTAASLIILKRRRLLQTN